MVEYIPRSEAIAELRHRCYPCGEWIEAINGIPAADVAPVVRERWGTGRFNLETGNYEEQCTHCQNFSKEYDKPYCPNCGAKMDGGGSDEAD